MPTNTAASKRSAQAGLAAAVLLLIACLIVLILGAREARAADQSDAPPHLSSPSQSLVVHL